MRKLLISLCLVAFLFTGCANGNWTWKDTVLETGWQTANIADWWQTRYIVDNPYMVEGNPLLGANPCEESLTAFFVSFGILHLLVSIMLPEDLRVYWQGISLGMKSGAVIFNNRGGVGLKPWWE